RGHRCCLPVVVGSVKASRTLHHDGAGEGERAVQKACSSIERNNRWGGYLTNYGLPSNLVAVKPKGRKDTVTLRLSGRHVQALSVNNSWRGYLTNYGQPSNLVFRLQDPKPVLYMKGDVQMMRRLMHNIINKKSSIAQADVDAMPWQAGCYRTHQAIIEESTVE
ncbi:hypothetical protein EJB05_13523, partial [Eragrostis curvula]